MKTSTTKTEKKIDQKSIMNVNLKRIIIGLTEIGNLDIEDFNTNYNITRTIANLNQVEKAYNKSVASLQNEYVKDIQNGFYVFENEENKKVFQEKATELDEKILDESTTKIWRIKASDLKKIKGIKGTTMAKCYELIIDDIDCTEEK